jgi:hypothetical protein
MTNDERSPKPEVRSSKEFRNPNCEFGACALSRFSSRTLAVPIAPAFPERSSNMIRISFGIRASEFGFLSPFVIRHPSLTK